MQPCKKSQVCSDQKTVEAKKNQDNSYVWKMVVQLIFHLARKMGRCATVLNPHVLMNNKVYSIQQKAKYFFKEIRVLDPNEMIKYHIWCS
jgi:hypothetical protein